MAEVASQLAQATDGDWQQVVLRMEFSAPDAARVTTAVIGASGKEQKVFEPPSIHPIIHKMRTQQAAASHPMWNGLEIVVNRNQDSQKPDFTYKFSYPE